MKHNKVWILAMALTMITTVHAENYGGYSRHGGMSAYHIDSNAYKYHYDHGFTGEDAAGWDSNLQYAWSRIAAAKTCHVPVDVPTILPYLVKEYGQESFIHEMVGIEFHSAQMKDIKDFCTLSRVAELPPIIEQMSKGKFVKKF